MRCTPVVTDRDVVDVGYIANEARNFSAQTVSYEGRVDLCEHDFVARMNRNTLKQAGTATIDSIDGTDISRLEGAFSAGPMITESDFNGHPINKDMSLGSKPPFVSRRVARIALFLAGDGTTHIRLFDGRPGSLFFEGVTPAEAVDTTILATYPIIIRPAKSFKATVLS